MTDAQARLLRLIAERVDRQQVVELHLFPAIRQGGSETGVAVVAVHPRRDGSDSLAGSNPDLIADAAASTPESETELAPSECDPTEDAAGSPPPTEGDGGSEDEPSATISLADSHFMNALGAGGEPLLVAARHDPTADRLTIYSARYRLTLKGPDRGKWEADIVPEADAPLSTVDHVVRGVQRRAGELAEPERLTGDAFRAALDAPSWTLVR